MRFFRQDLPCSRYPDCTENLQRAEPGSAQHREGCCLRGLDAEAEDSSGKTAAEQLAERVGTPPGLYEAFARLMEKVALANEESSTDGSYMEAGFVILRIPCFVSLKCCVFVRREVPLLSTV